MKIEILTQKHSIFNYSIFLYITSKFKTYSSIILIGKFYYRIITKIVQRYNFLLIQTSFSQIFLSKKILFHYTFIPPLKYNNPLPTLNILYSNLQATLTLPSKHPLKYNKPPPLNTQLFTKKF